MERKTVRKKLPDERIVALVGNPNVGKSTVFNALTGMKQHTGNWPGKTVDLASGRYTYKGKSYVLVDLPGTYSLRSRSEEERVTEAYLTSGEADCIVVVADAMCLERNLILALQIVSRSRKVVLCVNLLDEAERRGFLPDLKLLEREIGFPVIGTSANTKTGIEQLQEAVRKVSDGFGSVCPVTAEGEDLILRAKTLAAQAMGKTVELGNEPLDRIVLGKWSGRLLMVAMLLLVFWLTIYGANFPSKLLDSWFSMLGVWLKRVLSGWPQWLCGILVDGIYQTTADVVAVMLPPMAIFFPLFTLLEDFGYLPRAAFLMDHSLQKCGGCGKQVLTMAMGFGCNAAGVTGCRIISSPRERLLAILTNSLVPCNGRFPILITLISLAMTDNSVLAAVILTGCLLLSTAMTFGAGRILSATLLQRERADFVLELPPYRRPRIVQVFVRSMLDRTAQVLGRALLVAAPAGACLWLLENIQIGQQPLLVWLASALDPVGLLLGMNGAVLLAFMLSFPANELVLPLLLTICNAAELSELTWSWQMALCMMIFTLFHWPCSTTCLTIHKETGSLRWTLLAIAIPTVIGILLCMGLHWILLLWPQTFITS